jgi:hypothetical protein
MSLLYFDPDAQSGLRPTRACAERLIWFRDKQLPELLMAQGVPRGLYEATVANNPKRIAEMEEQYRAAVQYEMDRHGNVAAVFLDEK